jgi:hypothetical protein
MKAALVITSINDCSELLKGYLANFAKYGREASIYMIFDKKTVPQSITCPPSVKAPLFSEQEKFLKKVGFPPEDIPWNSDNRRNIGYLMALADGAEMIVSLDDDNYAPENEDFLTAHEKGLEKQYSCVSVANHWFNNCILLFPLRGVYPRGFPYYDRNRTLPKIDFVRRTIVPRINAGMWIGDPDFDAITWLGRGERAVRCSTSATLSPDTWCPINSQNTAVHRDLMPAYYFIRMVPPNDRFGDIFQGYFALKVAKAMGWTARFGSPVVTHKRNSHVYLKDVQKEIEPILLLEDLLPKLLEWKLTGATVHEAYLSLADFIEHEGTKFYTDTARLMRQWAETCRRISG